MANNAGGLNSLPTLAARFATSLDPASAQDFELAIASTLASGGSREGRPWTEEAAARVNRLMADHPQGDWPIRHCLEVLGAFPLHGTAAHFWSLRPDGVVLCFDLDSLRGDAEEEEDPLSRFAAMVHGAQFAPSLAPWIPPPPPGTGPCRECRTTGQSSEGLSCLACRGLGWRVG